MSYKIIVSLTTSPSRLLLLEPVIQSFLCQDYPISHVELNLPDKYKNTEEYVIPDFVENYKRLHIYRTGNDLGPATKIVPTIMRYMNSEENLYIISLDDDHRYPNRVVSTLLKGLVKFGNKNIYTIGGINVKVGAKNTLQSVNIYKTTKISVLEGVFGVLYNPRLFSPDIMDYMNTVIKSKECLTSDDITLSNYLAWKNIDIIRLNFKSFNKLLLYREFLFKDLAIKASEKDKNAIHLMPGGHKTRYFKACVFMKENNMLYLTIK